MRVSGLPSLAPRYLVARLLGSSPSRFTNPRYHSPSPCWRRAAGSAVGNNGSVRKGDTAAGAVDGRRAMPGWGGAPPGGCIAACDAAEAGAAWIICEPYAEEAQAQGRRRGALDTSRAAAQTAQS